MHLYCQLLSPFLVSLFLCGAGGGVVHMVQFWCRKAIL